MPKEIKDTVKEKYAEIVQSEKSCCCGWGTDNIFPDGSTDFSKDYSEISGYEKDADYGLGCGIPTGFVSIKKGDTVVDLGSGAGNDAFVARRFVGETGKVIGVDFTEAMIVKANENNKKLGYKNVEFRYGDIEKLPVENKSADIVISNCVMNLVPDKNKAFSEVHRILKEHGKFSISDIVVSGNLPDKLRKSASLYVGCVAGAINKQDYLNIIEKSGFKNVKILDEKLYILPEGLVKQYLSLEEYEIYLNSDAKILSITVCAEK